MGDKGWNHRGEVAKGQGGRARNGIQFKGAGRGMECNARIEGWHSECRDAVLELEIQC